MLDPEIVTSPYVSRKCIHMCPTCKSVRCSRPIEHNAVAITCSARNFSPQKIYKTVGFCTVPETFRATTNGVVPGLGLPESFRSSFTFSE